MGLGWGRGQRKSVHGVHSCKLDNGIAKESMGIDAGKETRNESSSYSLKYQEYQLPFCFREWSSLLRPLGDLKEESCSDICRDIFTSSGLWGQEEIHLFSASEQQCTSLKTVEFLQIFPCFCLLFLKSISTPYQYVYKREQIRAGFSPSGTGSWSAAKCDVSGLPSWLLNSGANWKKQMVQTLTTLVVKCHIQLPG